MFQEVEHTLSRPVLLDLNVLAVVLLLVGWVWPDGVHAGSHCIWERWLPAPSSQLSMPIPGNAKEKLSAWHFAAQYSAGKSAAEYMLNKYVT